MAKEKTTAKKNDNQTSESMLKKKRTDKDMNESQFNEDDDEYNDLKVSEKSKQKPKEKAKKEQLDNIPVLTDQE